LDLVSDALGQALASARRLDTVDPPAHTAGVLLAVEEVQRALSRGNPSFPAGKFRDAVRKAAGDALPRNGGA